MEEQPADSERDEERRELTTRQADTLIVGWVSFLAASLGTMLLFAWVDPLALVEIAEPPLPLDRMGGYALGFFFLWLLCVLSAGLCAYLIRTQRRQPGTDSDNQ